MIKDTCKGDSGGPLIIDNGGQPLLVGVLKVTKCLHAMKTRFYYNIVIMSIDPTSICPSRAMDMIAAQTKQAATEAGATSSLRGSGC